MQHRRFRLSLLAVAGVPLAVAALVSLLWPGPLALDDRIPLALLFGIPAVIVIDLLRHELG